MNRYELLQRLQRLTRERAELQQMGNGRFLVLVPLRDRVRLDAEIRELEQQLELMQP